MCSNPSIASVATHSAPGPLAGYLFQVERALFRLATGGRGTVVGIETLDDVATIDRQGRTILEQDKHYISRHVPLADRSKEFWNTLGIWLAAIDAEEVEVENTEFHFVTNKSLSKGLAYDIIKLQKFSTDGDWEHFVKKLRKAGANPPNRLKSIVKTVLSRTDGALIVLAKRIRVTDAGLGSCGEGLRETIADALHLDATNAPDVMNGLLGWLHDTTLSLLRSGKQAWFRREDFSERLWREKFAHSDKTFFRERAAAEIPVTDEQRRQYRENLFVKQLLWLGLPEDDEQLIEAMNDVYRSTTEAIRLTQKGIVTPNDFRAFDGRLVEKWKTLRRVHTPTPLPVTDNDLQAAGKAVLHLAMDHREKLAGNETQEWYLTRGAFHKLADVPRLGWHPNYQNKWKGLVEEEANRDPDHRS